MFVIQILYELVSNRNSRVDDRLSVSNELFEVNLLPQNVITIFLALREVWLHSRIFRGFVRENFWFLRKSKR